MSVELSRAALAFARFGLGPRPGDLSRNEDGLELLRHELKAGTVATPVGPDLITTPAILSLVQAEFQARRLARAAKPDGAVNAAGKPEEMGSPIVGNAPSSSCARPRGSILPLGCRKRLRQHVRSPSVSTEQRSPRVSPSRARCRSASSSGWCGSGPTTSRSRRQRGRGCGPRQVPSSAKRSGLTCSDASVTCCSRPNFTRPC